MSNENFLWEPLARKHAVVQMAWQNLDVLKKYVCRFPPLRIYTRASALLLF